MLAGPVNQAVDHPCINHVRLETTEIYTRVSIRQLQAIHSACHPGATNTRHRSPNHPALGNTRRDNDGDVEELLAVLDQEIEEENRAPDDERLTG
ncbi:MAG: hypothetical protein ACRD0D_12450 [Acidimicrobiales bacterium]